MRNGRRPAAAGAPAGGVGFPTRTGRARRDLQQVGDHHLLLAERQVVGVGQLLDALDLLAACPRNSSWNSKKAKSTTRAAKPCRLQQLGGPLLADDRELHQVGDAARRERLGQLADQVVDQVAAPVVERPVGRRPARTGRRASGRGWRRSRRRRSSGTHGKRSTVAAVMRSATPLRNALVSVLADRARGRGRSRARAPRRCARAGRPSSPLPQPTSRQRWPAPTCSRNRWRQTRKLPCVGTKTPGVADRCRGTAAGRASRPRASVQAARDGPRRGAGEPVSRRRRGRGARPGSVCSSAAFARRDVLAGRRRSSRRRSARPRRATAAPCCAYSALADVAVEAPAGVGEVAEVGVDAERQVGEVAQPRRACPPTWSGGMQLSSSAPTPISSKRRAARPNASPSGPAPVLAEDAAHALAAAAEAEPHRQPRVEQPLDRRVGRRRARATASRAGSGPAARRSNSAREQPDGLARPPACRRRR